MKSRSRRNWIFGLGLVFAAVVGVAAAVQGGVDRGVAGEGAEPAETVEDYLNPALSPEDSAAIMRDIDAHVERTRRRARAEAGLEEAEPQTTAPARRSGNDYQHCMASAAQANTAEDREIQSRGCRNLPGAPAP